MRGAKGAGRGNHWPHRASIWRRSAVTSGCSCPSRAMPRSFSSALPSAVPASVLAVVMWVAPPADNSAACLQVFRRKVDRLISKSRQWGTKP